MSTANCIPQTLEHAASGLTPRQPTTLFPLHRLAEVRRREEVSLRVVARRLNTSVTDVKFQEIETTDLPLSILYEWCRVLKVPVTELLVEPDDSLTLPLMKRAQLVRLMKTSMSILENAKQDPVKRMAQTMVDQLIQIMPELREVGSWHLVGKRRRREELGQAAERMLSEDMFVDWQE